MKNIFHKNLRALLDYCSSQFCNNKAFYALNGTGYTYKEFGEKTYSISEMLSKYGIGIGDKVGLISQNMPNWPVAFFSMTAFGRIAVPMLPDFSESDIKHILKHSEAKALFVSEKLLSKIKQKAVDRLSLIVKIDDFSIIKGEIAEVPAKAAEIDDMLPEDLASIIYTSGTTGSSKGVMLSHKNMCANLHSAQELRPSYEWDVWLSLLPLSHTLESSLCMMLPMQCGGSVWYLDKSPTPTVLMKAFAQVHPTSILSVPLIIEKVYKSAVLPAFKKNFLTRTIYKTAWGRKALNRIACKKLKEKFGGKIRFFGIGGAKLDKNVERCLYEGKFPYAIGYGLTETSPLLAGAIPEKVKIGSTGPVVDGVTVRIANPDPKTGIGEIQAKGDNVMMGYYKNPEATEETFTPDGWFKTKDLGVFDKKGWLFIKGRLNNTILGPSGENIYPEEIESIINSHDFVSESIVTENKAGKLVALVRFNQEKMKAFIEGELKPSAYEKVENLKKELMDYVNEKVNRFSKISVVEEEKEEFEKTATHKIKRYLYNK